MISVVKALLSSRKFAVSIIGVLAATAAQLGLEEPQATELARLAVGAAAVYVGATALEDAAEKRDVAPLARGRVVLHTIKDVNG